MKEPSRARGKAAERQVARRLGGRRVGRLGLAAPDVEGAWFIAEVKDRGRTPKEPYDILRRLRLNYPDERRIHLLVTKRPEWRDWTVTCLLSEFEDWYGTVLSPRCPRCGAPLKARLYECPVCSEVGEEERNRERNAEAGPSAA